MKKKRKDRLINELNNLRKQLGEKEKAEERIGESQKMLRKAIKVAPRNRKN